MTESGTIGVYFCDTGGGHGSAAQAIRDSLEIVARESSLDVRLICQPIIDQSHPFIGHVITFYNYLARHRPTWIKYLYFGLHWIRLESNFYYGLYSSYLHHLLEEQHPALIVACHPMIADALTYARGEGSINPSTKIVLVITDPNERLWRAWACKRADLFIAPNEIVRLRLLEWGIESAKIQVLGMPVHPKFLIAPSVSRAEFLSNLGLDPEVFTVCINSGWAGNEHLLNTCLALAKCKRKVQAVFLSGHNEELYKNALSKARQSSIPTAVLPYCDQMSDLMAAVDVMVTKAGGLTTYQALARRLPIVFDNTIEPMPQEAPTMQMVCSCGLGSTLDNPEDLAEIVDSLEFHSEAKPNLPEIYELNLTDQAVFNIARSLLEVAAFSAPTSSTAPHK